MPHCAKAVAFFTTIELLSSLPAIDGSNFLLVLAPACTGSYREQADLNISAGRADRVVLPSKLRTTLPRGAGRLVSEWLVMRHGQLGR